MSTSLLNTPTMLTYIYDEPNALAKIVREYAHTLLPLTEHLRGRQINSVMMLATGSSYNAALCARCYFEDTFGILVEIKEPYHFTHYERVNPSTSLVLAISQSGKSASTLAAMQKVQAAGIPVFCLTSDPTSPAAQAADGVLDLNTGIEHVGFVTRGFSATVLNLLLIALLIAGHQGVISPTEAQAERRVLQDLAQALPGVIEKSEAFIRRHHRAWQAASRYVAIGYGALVGVAREAETKFTETVRLPASGVELEAYMHGPYLEANPSHLLFFIEDTHNSRLRALRDYMQPHVSQVFTITLDDDDASDTVLSLGVPLSHPLSPLLLVVPFQLLSFHLAALRGVDLSLRIFDDFDRVLKSKI